MKNIGYLLVSCIAAGAVAGVQAENQIIPQESQRLFVANRDGEDVSVIDLKSLQLSKKLNIGTLSSAHMTMAWQSKTGQKLFVTMTGRNQVAVINVDKGVVEAVLPAGRSPEHFAIEKNEKHPDFLAYVGNFDDGSVSVIDLGQNKEIKRLSGFYEPHGITFTPDGSKVYVANFGAHRVDVIDARKHEVIKQISIGDVYQVASKNPERFLSEIKGIANVTLTPDGRYGYAADGDSNIVAVIDTQKDALIKTIPVGEEPWRAYGSPDGKWMLVPNNGEGSISVIDTQKQRVKTLFPAEGTITGINFVNGGKKAYALATTDNEALLYVYDLENLKEKGSILIGKNLRLETGSTSLDGKMVYIASSTDNSIYAIHADTDQVTRIPNVGMTPWGTAIQGDMAYYCH
jgi:YVTN family beta-propeller protein